MAARSQVSKECMACMSVSSGQFSGRVLVSNEAQRPFMGASGSAILVKDPHPFHPAASCSLKALQNPPLMQRI